MELFVRLLEMGVGDVGVNLCGRNVGVAEHLLDGADICAVLNEMRCERMPERVRRYVFKAATIGISLYE